MNSVSIHALAVIIYLSSLPVVCAWDGGEKTAKFLVDPGLSFSEKVVSLREQEGVYWDKKPPRKIIRKEAIEDGNRHLLGEIVYYKD